MTDLSTAGMRQEGLPHGWAWATLGDVTESAVSQDGPAGAGTFVYVDIGGIHREEKRISETKVLPVSETPSRARQMLQWGDVLVSTVRPNLNAVAMVPESLNGAIGSTGFHVLRSVHALPQYLFYLVRSHAFVDAMTRLVLGVLYPAIRPRDVAAYSFPFAPLADQRRTVPEIEKHFKKYLKYTLRKHFNRG